MLTIEAEAGGNSMSKVKSPLSVYFIWNNGNNYQEEIDYCFTKLCSDDSKPFSRSMNMPVYFRTNINGNVPKTIDFSSSDKSIIFIFIDEVMVVDRKKIWTNYINEINNSSSNKIKVIPVALHDSALKINSSIEKLNYIRLFDFDEKVRKQLLFIYMANEIFKFLKTNDLIRIFLSHTKVDCNAVALAQNIMRYIDHSPLGRFFDAFDIYPGVNFEDVIEDNVKKATIVSIHSDSYSSRPWCQKEILFAKKYNCPLLIVDFLEKFEDRRFPFLCNTPAVHVLPEDLSCNKLITDILEAAILETLRYNYSEIFLKYMQDIDIVSEKDCLILSHAPELLDIVTSEQSTILYPEPSLEHTELDFLNRGNKKCVTPLTIQEGVLEGKVIGLSISEPGESELLENGMSLKHVNIILSEITRNLLFRNAALSYGGDLRKSGYTEFIFELAKLQKERLGDKFKRITNYLAWPLYIKADMSVIAGFNDVAEFREIEPPSDIKDNIDYLDKFIPPDTLASRYQWARSFSNMRELMVEEIDARVCIGGRPAGYKSIMPGVLEEILLNIKNNKPLYLIGAFGGVTKAVTELLIGEDGKVINYDWQVENNCGYSDLVNYYNDNKPANIEELDYEAIVGIIKNYGLQGIAANNGLTVDENKVLFESDNFWEIISLIIKGLSKVK